MLEIMALILILALAAAIAFWFFLKQKNEQEKRHLLAERVALDARRIESEGAIHQLFEKQRLSDEIIGATQNQFKQLDKRYYALFKAFKDGFEIVRQRQSEIEDRLTLGTKGHQEIRNRLDEISDANVSLNAKILHAAQALGEAEERLRSQGSDRENALQDVKARIDDFESRDRSLRSRDQETEMRLEELSGALQETEKQLSDVRQANGEIRERLTSLAKTLDGQDSLFRAYQKETGDFTRDLMDKMIGLGLQVERFQKEVQEASSHGSNLHETVAGLRETITSLEDGFTRELNLHSSGMADRVSALGARLEDQHVAYHQLGEKSLEMDLKLKEMSDRWERLYEQQSAKRGELLEVIEGATARVTILEEQLTGIRQTGSGTEKSVQDLSGELSILQRDLQSVREDVRARNQEQRLVENKLEMIKKIIHETETELEEQRKNPRLQAGGEEADR